MNFEDLNRIVVTGLGVISPLALNVQFHFDRLLAHDSAVEVADDPIYRNYSPFLQARIREFDRRELITDRMLRKLLPRSPAFALAAATEAILDAGIFVGELRDCGLFVGSIGLDGDPESLIPALLASMDANGSVDLSRFATRGIKLVDPLFLVKALPNAGLCAIAIQHGVLGPNANITNGAVSGLQAVIAAVKALQRGDAELALAGGYDSLLGMDCVVEHSLAGRLADNWLRPGEGCRPFDRWRCGYALGEGAAFLMLETLDHARRRSATIYAELFGFAETAAASCMVHPSADGEALAIAAKRAIEKTSPSSRIDLLLGSGLATEIDDAREVRAWAGAFPDASVPFSACTGSLGFLGAATGAFSVVHAALSIRRGVLPPMINCDEPVDISCLGFVHRTRVAPVRRVLVWASDHGIKNASLVVGACEGYVA